MDVPDHLHIVRCISKCHTGQTCPAVLELSNKHYAAIGSRTTAEEAGNLRPIKPGEVAIIIPRSTLLRALSNIKAA